MDKIRKILAPTDLSELSRVGLRRALEIAQSQQAEVIAYHVIGYDEFAPEGPAFDNYLPARLDFRPFPAIVEERKRLLAKFLRENFADLVSKVKLRQEVEVGIPYKSILEKSVEEGVDMIVLSTHGRTGLLHILIGSVTEKVVRQAICPVLSIRPASGAKLAEAAARMRDPGA